MHFRRLVTLFLVLGMTFLSALNALAADVPIAAYEQAIEASHVFNLLQARGVISVQERASYMARVRDLARGSCEAYMAKEAGRWAAEYAGWSA